MIVALKIFLLYFYIAAANFANTDWSILSVATKTSSSRTHVVWLPSKHEFVHVQTPTELKSNAIASDSEIPPFLPAFARNRKASSISFNNPGVNCNSISRLPLHFSHGFDFLVGKSPSGQTISQSRVRKQYRAICAGARAMRF